MSSNIEIDDFAEDVEEATSTPGDEVAKLMMPSAILNRILKDEGLSASKTGRDLLNRACAVFLLKLSDASFEAARASGHRTLSSCDVAKGLEELDLPSLLEYVNTVMLQWRMKSAKRNVSRAKDKPAAARAPNDNEEDVGQDDDDEEMIEYVESADLDQPGPSSS